MKRKSIKKIITLGLALTMSVAGCIIVTASSKDIALTDKTNAFYESTYSNHYASASTSITSDDDYNVTRVQVSATAYVINPSSGASYVYDSKSAYDDFNAEVSFSSSTSVICGITSYHYSYIELTNGYGYSNSDYLSE